MSIIPTLEIMPECLGLARELTICSSPPLSSILSRLEAFSEPPARFEHAQPKRSEVTRKGRNEVENPRKGVDE